MKKNILISILLILILVIGIYIRQNFIFNIPSIDQDIAQSTPTQGDIGNNLQQVGIQEKSDPHLNFINLPEGFTITEFASVDNARSMSIYEGSSKNIVFVGNRDSDKVYALIDKNKQNRASETIILAQGLDMPNGVAFDGKDLYVAEQTRIIVFKDIINQINNRGNIQSGEFYDYEVFLDGFPKQGITGHGRKYLALGPDNNLYMSIGSPCNVCESKALQGTIIKIDLETKNQTIVAKGIRNSVGFDREEQSGKLWFTDNGRDLMGDNIPPDELNTVTSREENFGFPYCHGGDIPDPTYNTRDCSEFTPPVIKLGPHVAALGMKFYDGDMFPEEYKGKIFIAEHGSWNRSIPIGYRITIVDKDVLRYEIFADGWLLPSGKKAGRPVDIQQLSDGSLLVSDDAAGKIYRIAYSN